MKAEFINPFVAAAFHVVQAETGEPPVKGDLRMEETHYTTTDITVLIGVVGKVSGSVLFGFGERTAKQFVSAMLGQTVAVFDSLAESALGELGNMITGRASGLLEQAGYPCTISPPTLIIGRGTIISTNPVRRLCIPVVTRFGEISISVALRETPNVAVPAHLERPVPGKAG